MDYYCIRRTGLNRGSGELYIKGINRVQDYIENHLDEPLKINELAKIAAFSEFHFQRIFSALTGETLYGFIRRLRLEKAAFMLLSDRNRPLTDIALSVGFSNQASLAKAFRQHFGISGSEYRRLNGAVDAADFTGARSRETGMDLKPLQIEVRNEDARNLVYIRYTGPYKGDSALFSGLFERLYRWADQRGLVSAQSGWYVIYHDFGYETDQDLLRLSVCMSVDRNVAVSGEVGYLELPAGRYGIGSFSVGPDDYAGAWYHMYAKWLPESGYKPDDRFSLEHYPAVDCPDGKRLVEICVPVT